MLSGSQRRLCGAPDCLVVRNRQLKAAERLRHREDDEWHQRERDRQARYRRRHAGDPDFIERQRKRTARYILKVARRLVRSGYHIERWRVRALNPEFRERERLRIKEYNHRQALRLAFLQIATLKDKLNESTD
jgi:hypothetical protein